MIATVFAAISPTNGLPHLEQAFPFFFGA